MVRFVFHVRKEKLRQRCREGMEDRPGALEELRASGVLVQAEDVARLLPLLHEHVNMLGQYDFTLSCVFCGMEYTERFLRSVRNKAESVSFSYSHPLGKVPKCTKLSELVSGVTRGGAAGDLRV
ncbi:MAG: hypothetical protein ACR2J4_01055 [Deinococcus sp.]